MPVSLCAKKNLRYAGEAYAAGAPFEARDEADAVVLRMTGLAVDAPTPQPDTPVVPEPVIPEPPEIEPESVEADPSSDAPTESEPPKRRTYRRRDMTASRD